MEFSAESSFPINKLVTDSSSLGATCIITVLEGEVFPRAQEIVIIFPTTVHRGMADEAQMQDPLGQGRPMSHNTTFFSPAQETVLEWSESLTLQG